MRGPGAGDPIEAELVRLRVRARLFGDPEPTVKLGRFELYERIGAGGMGVVYAAFDPELHRTVAVKVLTEEGADLLDEARAMAAVRHPSLVAVHDVGEWQGHVFLAMERVEGPSLRAWLATPRRAAEIVRVFAGAGRALAALHAAKFVHRDFKPDNVVIDVDGRARLVDFGLARRDDAATDLAGTPAYLAPEIVRGAPASAASDQYAFCVALAACALPARVRRIVARGRDEDPAARWPSMTALVDALEHDPAARWRRGLAVAAVAGGLGVAVALLVGPDEQPAPPHCGDGAEHLVGVWDDARRAEVKTAFDATKLAYADPMRTAVEGGLDAYVDDWKRARIDACEATEVKHEQSPDLLDRRMICLDRRLAALDATIDVLADADAGVVERARAITDALPAIDLCADATALRATVPPPDDATARARLDELEPRRAAGVALAAAARFDDAIEALDAVVADARVLGYAPFLAEALLALGAAQNTANREGARETLFEGTMVAQAHGHVRAVADGALSVAGFHVFHEEWSEARTWTGLADASITAAGDNPRLRARWHSAMVQLLFNQGHANQALDHAERAVAILVERGDEETTGYANALSNLGMVLGQLGRREDAQARLTEALHLRERLLGPTHPEIAETLNRVAIMDENFERYDDALTGYHRAYEIAVAATGPRSVLAARYLDHEAGALRSLGRVDESLAKKLEALEIREAELPVDSSELAASYSSVGTVLMTLHRYEEAEQRLLQAKAIQVKAFGEVHQDVAASWLNLADAALDLEHYQDAIDRETRAIAIYESMLGKHAAELVYPLTGVGIANLELGHARAALPPLERAVSIAEASTEWPSEKPRARFVLAQALLAVGDRPGARAAAMQARDEYAALERTEKAANIAAWIAGLPK